MAEGFLQLPKEERRDALGVAAAKSGRPTHLLEKDVWVVWALSVIFESEFGPHLVFKGGTSLSKAYGAVRRFSEDIDLTYDIRAIAEDLVGNPSPEAIPESKSQGKKWTEKIRERLANWVSDSALQLVRGAIEKEKLPANAPLEPGEIHVIRIEYEQAGEESSYVKPIVILEFGARSTGEPCEQMPIKCDAAEHLPTLTFPVSTPRVMKAERTFWEKATAVHVFCLGGKVRDSRFARHWYDLAQLDASGHAAKAQSDKELALQVANHKSKFFAEKDGNGQSIEYSVAVSGSLQLVPTASRLAQLAEDYEQMVEDGLLVDAARPFEEIIEVCRRLQERVNAAMLSG
jgi:hypothetical protein